MHICDLITLFFISKMEELFNTLPVEFLVRHRSPGGTTYIYSWTEDLNKGELSMYLSACQRCIFYVVFFFTFLGKLSFRYMCFYNTNHLSPPPHFSRGT